jgi:hypothetical protein
MPRRLVPLLSIFAVGCVVDSQPDARFASPPIDAAPARPDGGGAADGPLAVDAAPPHPDAGEPDASPPDAGPAGPATVILNELSPNLAQSHDLVELLVTVAGTTNGIQLERDPQAPVVLATLPDVMVAAGDLIVVHLAPAGTTATAETMAKDEAATADNYADAWDFLGTSDDIPFSDVVLSIRGADGVVTSAVPFVNRALGPDPDMHPRTFPGDVDAVIAAGLWAETCDPTPCDYGGNLESICVDWEGAGTTADPSSPSGASVSRVHDARDHHDIGDWQVPNPAGTPPYSSFGAPN